MCGRFVVEWHDDWVDRLKVAVQLEPDRSRRYNVAPTQPINLVRDRFDDGQRELRMARWGLVPSWAKDPSIGGRMINARSETVVEKPSFRAAAARRRCIIPASGYYEWQKTGSRKQPYYLSNPDDDLLAFAGLYEQWRPQNEPDTEPLWTATIITRAASDVLGAIHDRTPVILTPDLWDDWLAPNIIEKADVTAMLAAAREPHLTPRPVDTAVGNVRSQGPSLIEPIEI